GSTAPCRKSLHATEQGFCLAGRRLLMRAAPAQAAKKLARTLGDRDGMRPKAGLSAKLAHDRLNVPSKLAWKWPSRTAASTCESASGTARGDKRHIVPHYH